MKRFAVNMLKNNEDYMFQVLEEGEEFTASARFISMNRPVMNIRDAVRDSLNKPMQVVNFVDGDGKEYSVLTRAATEDGFVSVNIYDFELEELNSVHDAAHLCEIACKCMNNKFCSLVGEVVQEYLATAV